MSNDPSLPTPRAQGAVPVLTEIVHDERMPRRAVDDAALEALARARHGAGPVFLLCETERLTGHYIGDPQVYRHKDELRTLQETRDPIQNLRDRLALSDEEWTGLETEAQRVVDASLEFAKAGTDPSPSDALKNVYVGQ